MTGDNNERLLRLATYASVGVAFTLVAAKLGAWLLTDSISLLSSLVDSLLDAFASVITLFAVRQSLEPADANHRFGHGKAEPLAGLAQAAFLAGSAVFLVIEAARRLFHQPVVEHGQIGIIVMVFSIALTIGLVRFQNFVVKRTQSVAIGGDMLHYTGDILINGGVIVALGSSMWLGWPMVDPLIGVSIAGFLLVNSVKIGRQSLNLLMDHEFKSEDRQRIRDITVAHAGALAMHDLRTRSSGPHQFIQLHLEMDRELPLWRAHDIADSVEMALRDAFPNAEVIIHQDPAGLVEAHPEFSFETPGESVDSDAGSVGVVSIVRANAPVG